MKLESDSSPSPRKGFLEKKANVQQQLQKTLSAFNLLLCKLRGQCLSNITSGRRESAVFEDRSFVTLASFVLIECIFPVRKSSRNECLLHARDRMQMMVLV